jgi:hypothetical protein
MILCGLFEWKRICTDLSANYEYKKMYMLSLESSYQEGGVGIQLSRGRVMIQLSKGGLGSSYQEGRVGIPLTGLTLPHWCACREPVHGFLMLYVVVFCVWSVS